MAIPVESPLMQPAAVRRSDVFRLACAVVAPLILAGSHADNLGYQTYQPPTSGRGKDWVLLLEGVK